MKKARLRSIEQATFRSNAGLELVTYKPPRGTRALQASGREDKRYVAALRPQSDHWLGAHAVDAVVVRLLRACTRPKELSRAIIRSLGDTANSVLAKLVLDGILEIETSSGFVHGADAHQHVVRSSIPMPANLSATARLSLNALRFADALHQHTAKQLADQLYYYHRKPATVFWCNRLADSHSTEQFLGVSSGSVTRKTLELHWARDKPVSDADGWASWSPNTHHGRDNLERRTFKLFVSPDAEHAPAALQAVVEVLANTRAVPFKYGGGAFSLLRPDKMVAYFATLDHLRECASALWPKLRTLHAHGVPFTADLSDTGLISWGIDPARSSLPWSSYNTQSWRVTVVSRLARSLIAARHARHGEIDRVQLALDRMSLDSVDVTTWAPAD